MTQSPSAPPTSPLIAAARGRRARGQLCARRGGGGGGKPKNNYLAETGLSPGKLWGNKKGAGARPGNLNAVLLPHRTAEQIALYRRVVAWHRNTKALLAYVRARAKSGVKPRP